MSDMAAIEAGSRRRLFTVDEFHGMFETGVLQDGERLELIDGVVVAMSPIGSRHWARHAAVVRYLNDALRDRAFVVPQGSFPLGNHDEPQPDIALLVPGDYEGSVAEPDAFLAIVEIAESSLRLDLGAKARLYARYGVPDYLVVDIAADVLVRHAEPSDDGYQRVEKLRHSATLSLARVPDVVLDVASFLGPSTSSG